MRAASPTTTVVARARTRYRAIASLDASGVTAAMRSARVE